MHEEHWSSTRITGLRADRGTPSNVLIDCGRTSELGSSCGVGSPNSFPGPLSTAQGSFGDFQSSERHGVPLCPGFGCAVHFGHDSRRTGLMDGEGRGFGAIDGVRADAGRRPRNEQHRLGRAVPHLTKYETPRRPDEEGPAGGQRAHGPHQVSVHTRQATSGWLGSEPNPELRCVRNLAGRTSGRSRPVL
jgi:hypothetical protein